ncbi:MAG: hypothetical protein AB2L14_28690 [Candidatus Xenobiia bacterium LiM19]
MSARNHVYESLGNLFARRPVVDLGTLKRSIGTNSRTTVFRVLSQKGYLTSYNHAGRYYTLKEIPEFDEDGLWAHGDVFFSRHGSLRATIAYFVDNSIAGQTHRELQERLRLRVHDSLHDLVVAEKIGRVEIELLYLYVNTNNAIAETQIAERHRLLSTETPPAPLPDSPVIIEILLAFIHLGEKDPAALARHLRRQGIAVSSEEIETVFTQYALGKKKPVLRRFRR